jgi:hypothetical protein
VVRTLALLIIPLAAACGRRDFDVLTPSPDAAADATPPDGAPPVLSCSTPPRFSINASTTQLSATARLQGYDVFTVDGAGAVQGFSYAFDTNDLATARLGKQASDVPVTTNATGTLGVFAVGDDVLVAAPYGRPTVGTALIPLDAQLGLRGAPIMFDGVYGTGPALARNSNGTLAFAAQPTLKAIDVQLVSVLGVAGGPSVQVTDGGADMNNPAIMAVGSNFLVVWNTSAVHAQLFDDQLVAQPGIQKVSSDGAGWARAAYAPAAARYLIAWHQKVTTGPGDEVWVSLRDSSLSEIKAIKVAAQGVYPAIAAGDSDFLVVWQDSDIPTHLGATRIAMDGTVSPVGVADTGGTATAWDLVVHNGQPALAWVETGGTGPNLWLDPLCH